MNWLVLEVRRRIPASTISRSPALLGVVLRPETVFVLALQGTPKKGFALNSQSVGLDGHALRSS